MSEAMIYLVTAGEYSSYHVVAAFSTEAKAQAFITERTWLSSDGPALEALPVDRWEMIKDRAFWRVTMTEAAGPPEAPTVAPATTDVFPLDPLDADREPRVDYWERSRYYQRRAPDTLLPAYDSVRFTQPSWHVIVEADDAGAAVKIAAERVALEKARRAGIA
jgi:hypothetical protein